MGMEQKKRDQISSCSRDEAAGASDSTEVILSSARCEDSSARDR